MGKLLVCVLIAAFVVLIESKSYAGALTGSRDGGFGFGSGNLEIGVTESAFMKNFGLRKGADCRGRGGRGGRGSTTQATTTTTEATTTAAA